jgi:hypothetical protein
MESWTIPDHLLHDIKGGLELSAQIAMMLLPVPASPPLPQAGDWRLAPAETHVLGDRAVTVLLDAIAAAYQRVGRPSGGTLVIEPGGLIGHRIGQARSPAFAIMYGAVTHDSGLDRRRAMSAATTPSMSIASPAIPGQHPAAADSGGNPHGRAAGIGASATSRRTRSQNARTFDLTGSVSIPSTL